ncbi:hypothetical protein [Rubellimicrobium roseum]|uniref:hypothetical protein n=1 Tax=Rubellimicrobium roseum TaxID=687525 RepID=UPI00159BB424|nr:hypothetical protein [Rubellimicrobium roseum]
MSDYPLDELAALRDLIPPDLGPEVLDTWKRTGAAALTERGQFSPNELEGDGAAQDYSALDRLDARAEAELVAAFIVAAGVHGRREA